LDLWLHDFYTFGPLKKALKGCMFMLDDSVQQPLVWGFTQQPKESLAARIHQLVDYWHSM
jgi:hypothetical protein